MAFGKELIWPQDQYPWKITQEQAAQPQSPKAAASRKGINTRRERRIPFPRLVTLHVVSDDGHDVATDAHLADISGRGLGLRVSHRLGLGQRFSINLATRLGPCAYVYEVTHAAMTPDDIWHMGAKSIGVLGRHGTDRAEKIIMALMTGTPDRKSA